MNASSPTVLLLDDGELDDARALLEQIGADFVHLRGQGGPAPLPLPRVLLIASARRAIAFAQERKAPHLSTGAPVHPWDAGRDDEGAARPVGLVVVTEDSPTLRTMLREAGFDVLVRRPVHPTVLRLLVLRALYQGPEKRGEERVPLGDEVVYRAGPGARRGVLADLSRAGCRLISRYGARRGMRITVEAPDDGAPGGSLPLHGRVLRCSPADEGAVMRELAIAVEFEALAEPARQRLEALLHRRAAAARASEEQPLGPEAPQDEAERENRRQHRRGSYPRRVLLLQDQASRVVMGRDLSVNGMRIDPHPELSLGSSLRLAVYANAREEPLLLTATVVRADAEGAVALRFEGIEARVARRLEALVSSLPAVESLHDSEAESLGAVVAEILPR